MGAERAPGRHTRAEPMRRVARSLLVTAVAAALWLPACSQDLAHDPAMWSGAPWGLRDADLPDDRPSIRATFGSIEEQGLFVLPPYALLGGRQIVLNLSFDESAGGARIVAAALVPEPGTGAICSAGCYTKLSGCDPCTTSDMLRAIAREQDAVVTRMGPVDPPPFVATAFDYNSQSGAHGTIAALWFADPDGSWVYEIDASTVDDVRIAAEALARALGR